ncbi:MAG: minor capsid protein, partial [Aliifodinibius sp.]|nr:minor capsid protein [Fodinibius sp.]NIV13929.1 minor capsid protein [Fodinibius sp.]NIY27351.1 minor capsid protein [Fodinibius sp.]
HDLVRMSTHFPTSDLCVDWQGGVYSQSGQSDNYPSLQTAIEGGAFHVNCKHSLGGYFPGTSPAKPKQIDKRKNAEMYEA